MSFVFSDYTYKLVFCGAKYVPKISEMELTTTLIALIQVVLTFVANSTKVSFLLRRFTTKKTKIKRFALIYRNWIFITAIDHSRLSQPRPSSCSLQLYGSHIPHYMVCDAGYFRIICDLLETWRSKTKPCG